MGNTDNGQKINTPLASGDYALREAVAQNSHSPEWFRTTSQSELFKRLFTANDLE